MVFDKIDNIEIYKGLSKEIYEGLNYLKQIKPDIANGVYEISSRVKAIVSEYETKLVNVHGYEAHKRFIDIHYVLIGEERVCSLPIEKLNETQAYCSDKDVAFYDSESLPQQMIIGNNYFAIFFPQDGHMPQLCLEKPSRVKKVVIKVEIK